MTPQPHTAHPQPAASPTLAWIVHVYTATGAVLAFVMTIAVINARYRLAFLMMIAATVIDSTDGLFARLARVKEATPAFDGGRLDDIVDYLTFVFVPAMLLSSAYGFSAADAKTDDHFFTGFPSYWNIAALYLFAAHLTPTVNASVLLVLSALVFVRIRYVYPSRTPILR